MLYAANVSKWEELLLLTIAAADGKCALLTNVRCCKQSKAKQTRGAQMRSVVRVAQTQIS